MLAELDICARVIAHTTADGEQVWVGCPQPTEAFIGKDGTGTLGPRRVLDLSRWIELAREGTALPAESDLPWDSPEPEPGGEGTDTPLAPTGEPTEDIDTSDMDTPARTVADELPSDSLERIAAEVFGPGVTVE